MEIGLGNEEHRGGEAGWKEACTARRDEQEQGSHFENTQQVKFP